MAALALAGCGGSSSSSSGSSGTPAATDTPTATQTAAAGGGGASTLKIAADPGGAKTFTSSALTAKAGKLTVEFSNPSQLPHAVVIEGNGVDQKSDVVTGKDAPPITVDLKPGTYTFYCPVGDHRAAGMEGKLTVE
jgi:plastocyanin